jgi:hypothetical protein
MVTLAAVHADLKPDLISVFDGNAGVNPAADVGKIELFGLRSSRHSVIV